MSSKERTSIVNIAQISAQIWIRDISGQGISRLIFLVIDWTN